MLINFGILLRLGLFLVGCVWCKEVFERFGRDVDEINTSDDNVRKFAIIVIWLITVLIVYWLVAFLWSVFGTAIRSLR